MICRLAIVLSLAAAEQSLAANLPLAVKEVTVDGVADLSVGSEAAARDAAIRNAQRNAIETVVGAVIESSFSAEQREALKNNRGTFESKVQDQIYAKSAGYIESQQLVAEGRQGNTYRVTLRVVVKSTALKDELAQMQALLKAVHNPKVALLVTERYTNQRGEARWIERPAITPLIEDALLKRGIELVAKDQIVALGHQGMSNLGALIGNDSEVAELASQYGADIAVVGTSEVRFSAFNEFNDGLYYVSVTLSLRAVNAATTKILASTESVGRAAGVNEDLARVKAVANAAPKVIGDLIDGLVQTWQLEADKGKSFRVVLFKVKDYGKVARPFMKAVEQVPDVTQVREVNFGIGRLELQVTFKGSKGEFLDRIFEHVGGQKKFRKLNKISDHGDSIDLTL